MARSTGSQIASRREREVLGSDWIRRFWSVVTNAHPRRAIEEASIPTAAMTMGGFMGRHLYGLFDVGWWERRKLAVVPLGGVTVRE
jgi:hypothetical protein